MTDRVILVEDIAHVAKFYMKMLENNGLTVETAATSQDFFPLFEKFDPDLILLDIHLKNSELNGVGILRELKKRDDFHAEVIVMSSEGSRSEVAEAMKLGARNFHEKAPESFNPDKFIYDVKETLELHHKNQRIFDLDLQKLDTQLVGQSAVMQKVKRQIIKLAKSDINILITGETGTGKGVVANMLHDHSGRENKPFKSVNIQNLAETLVEGELFGKVRGAHTDARTAVKGYFERAHRGTLFIDEISSLSLANQGKILTVIEDKTVPIVGSGGANITVDVRIIAATNRDLPSSIVKGDFRDDLYFRLAVGIIDIPPLRKRERDVLEIMKHYLYMLVQEHNLSMDFSLDDIADSLLSYDWPGNIREVKNLCQRIAAMHQTIDNQAILDEFETYKSLHGKIYDRLKPCDDEQALSLLKIKDYQQATDAFEKQYIEYHLDKAHGQVTKAAQSIGIDRTTLYKKMRKHGIEG